MGTKNAVQGPSGTPSRDPALPLLRYRHSAAPSRARGRNGAGPSNGDNLSAIMYHRERLIQDFLYYDPNRNGVEP